MVTARSTSRINHLTSSLAYIRASVFSRVVPYRIEWGKTDSFRLYSILRAISPIRADPQELLDAAQYKYTGSYSSFSFDVCKYVKEFKASTLRFSLKDNDKPSFATSISRRIISRYRKENSSGHLIRLTCIEGKKPVDARYKISTIFVLSCSTLRNVWLFSSCLKEVWCLGQASSLSDTRNFGSKSHCIILVIFVF